MIKKLFDLKNRQYEVGWFIHRSKWQPGGWDRIIINRKMSNNIFVITNSVYLIIIIYASKCKLDPIWKIPTVKETPLKKKAYRYWFH